ncbi:MAG: hypothetical protein IT383_13120 [Deltaproteobacteria bacterium]|nr:hypothetical protein [Deltaproteobacteria bacterium]
MGNASRFVLALAVLAVAVLGAGCSTVLKPTRPDTPLVADGPPLAGVRFDGESTVLREPGLPLSPSRTWQREVQNYTATSLNTLLSTDDDAPPARTIASMDLAGPSALQIGTWKEMSIGLTSTLPDGTLVRSEPVTGNIDDGFEYAVTTTLGVSATVLEVASVAALLYSVVTRDQNGWYVVLGSLVGGIALYVAQSSSQYIIAASEQTRWSNLYANALTKHARDVRGRIGSGPPPRPPAPVPSPTDAPSDPSDAPPPLLEPKPVP